jgi:subtilisin family serine protease
MTGKRNQQDDRSRYVLLPVQGTHSPEMTSVGTATATFKKTLTARLRASSATTISVPKSIDIIHSASATGAKLAELSPQELAALQVQEPAVRAVPVVTYHLTRTPRLAVTRQKVKSAKAQPPLRVKVVDQAGKPVIGALVVALNNEKDQIGHDGFTSKKGEVRLRLPSGPQLEVLAVYPDPNGHWGSVERNLKLVDGHTVTLDDIDLAHEDFVTTLYKTPKATDGTGVVVGVIDSGVDGTHPHLTVKHSRCLVSSEGDAGDGSPATEEGEHGTHVAGLIAGALAAGTKRGGRAPAVTLNSYRVFPNNGGDAINYDILRAIEAAVEDGCDLINLSLGTTAPDEAVRDAIKEAFAQGTVCIAAAGNYGREDLLFPARWSDVLSITAIGQKGTYPATSVEVLYEAAPWSKLEKKRYAARFTNIGPEVVATAPGVGIVSTVPGGGYGAMSGTSMACPVACGLLAAELARHDEILKIPRGAKRGRERANEIRRLFFAMCKPAGFDKEYEGQGLPR